MNERKEKLIRDYAHDYRDVSMTEAELTATFLNFSDQLIQGLIGDIPDEMKFINILGYNDTGFLQDLKQQLRDNWL